MNTDTRMFTIIKLIRGSIYIFIDTFFTVYFFKLCNYDILPIGIYYLTSYLSLTFGFWILRSAIKRNIKVPYYRIGIALIAVYLSLILLLKDNIGSYIILVAFIKGFGEGLYYFPTNVFDTEKIDNKHRIKYQGTINIINVISGILMPLIIGVVLTYYSYINTGKVFIAFIILIFILSFWVKDVRYNHREFNINKFRKIVDKNPYLKDVFLIRFLSGFTFVSGVLTVVISLYSIIYFKTNLNIGILNSSLAVLSLITLSLYAYIVKPKTYQRIVNISLLVIIISLLGLGLYPGIPTLVIYLVLSNSAILFLNIMISTIVANVTNNVEEIKKEFKAEYHLCLEIFLNIGRVMGYVVFLLIGIFGSKDNLYIIIGISLVSLIWLCLKLKSLLKKVPE